MSTLNLTIPSTSSRPRKPEPEAEPDEEDEEEEPPARGKSLGMVLLMSYASAVTIALLWVLWSHHRASDTVEAQSPSASESPADSESISDQPRKSLARTAIPASQVVGLGESVRLGLISVTPVSVSSGQVTLVRNFGARERRNGGKGALKLRLRIKNLSDDTVIAPLDVAFLRQRPGDGPETEIETQNQDEPYILMYPLARESEWSIEGEDFRDLEPGGVYETTIVTAPGAVAKTSPAMTWRLRLRTDLDHSEDIGVRFRAAEIKHPKPAPDRSGDSQNRKKK